MTSSPSSDTQSTGGVAPGGVTDGHMPGSAHYEGRAVDVFFRPISEASKDRGWAMAQYLVAHAARLHVKTVIFDGRIWTSGWRSDDGWRAYEPDTSGRDAGTAAILEHRDHVHVDVSPLGRVAPAARPFAPNGETRPSPFGPCPHIVRPDLAGGSGTRARAALR